MSGQSPPPGQSGPSRDEQPADSSNDSQARNLDPAEVSEENLHDTVKDATNIDQKSSPSNPSNKQQQTHDKVRQPQETQNKIEVLFMNTPPAKMLKKQKWYVRPTATISDMIAFIRKSLRLEASQSIFIYVTQSFAPPLDQTMQNLFDCYECDKKLVLYYATIQAWG